MNKSHTYFPASIFGVLWYKSLVKKSQSQISINIQSAAAGYPELVPVPHFLHKFCITMFLL